MKKLMIALAAAATTMFSFGDGNVTLPTGTSFEALTEGPVSVSNIVNRSDAGSPTGDFYWSSTATADAELGVITNDVADAQRLTEVGRPYMFSNETQGKSLFIDIGQTTPLVRTALPNSSGVQPVDIGDGIYLDTLVKFTAADEAFAENLTGGDKIAIEYVEHEAEGDDVGYTNFVVRAGLIGAELGQTNYYAYVSGDPAFTNFNKDVWHRLTVRAIANVGDGNVGFVIYLDGNMEKTLEYSKDVDAGFGSLNALAQTFYNTDKHALFPSAIAAGATGGSAISSVAFSGNGFIDDVSFTATKPTFINEAILVTIAWDEHVTGMTINGTVLTAEQVAEMSWTGEPNNGAVIAIPTFEAGYVAGAPVLPTGATYDSDTKTFGNLTAGMTCTIKSMFPYYEVDGVSFDDLDAAIEAAAAGTAQAPATFKLLADCGEMIKFTSGYVVLDLAGYNIQGTDEQAFSVVCQGAHMIVTNSVPATGAVKRPVESEDAAGAMQVKGDDGAVAVYVAKFDDIISVKPDSAEKTAIFAIYSGTFIDEDAGNDPDEFAYNVYVQNGATVTSLGNNYFQVGESGGGDTPTEIDVPTAASNLVYDGTEQTGVAAGTGYTLTGVTAATNAGEYTATATLEEGYVWSDTTTEAKSINWSIAPKTDAAVVVTLTSEIAEYSAQLEFPTASATIGGDDVAGTPAWDPATISEPEAGATNTYTVTFTVTTANYAGSTGTATFKVYKAAGGGSNWPAGWNSGTEPASMATAFETWIAAGNDPTAKNAEAAFLVGVNVADYTSDLAAASISIVGGKIVITGNYDLTKINGALSVKMGDAPNALNTTTAINELTDGAISLTPGLGETKKFYQLVIGYPAN